LNENIPDDILKDAINKAGYKAGIVTA